MQTWSSLSTVTTVTSRDVRKIVNKVFIVTVDNFDVGGVAFVIAAIVEEDSAVDFALVRRWMSSREPAVQMGSTGPSLPVSFRSQFAASLSYHAVPPRTLPI